MRGVWTALITPFNENNELDLLAFRKILKDQRDAGISGVIPCGTTGESPTLTVSEKKKLILTTLDELKGTGVKVFAGTGTNNTAETLEFSTWADQQGVDGLLIVTPYYNKPSQAGLETHYRTIADAVSCDIMLYNVPGRTGISLTAETVVRLAEHPRIRSLKEATGIPSLTSEILDLLLLRQNSMKHSLDVLSGDDATYLPLLSIGAVGVVSVVSNLFPRAMVALQTAAENGRFEEAQQIHQSYYPLMRDLFIESNPVPIKFAMSWAGWCADHVRLPLVALSPSSVDRLKQSLIRCKIKKGKPL